MTSRTLLSAILPACLPAWALAASGQALQSAWVDHAVRISGVWSDQGPGAAFWCLGILKAACVLLGMFWAAHQLGRLHTAPLRPRPWRDLLWTTRLGRPELLCHCGMVLAAAAIIPIHIFTIAQVKSPGLSPMWVLADGATVGTLAVLMGAALWGGTVLRGRID